MTDRHATIPHHVEVTFQRGYSEWLAQCSDCHWTGSYTTIKSWAFREAQRHMTEAALADREGEQL